VLKWALTNDINVDPENEAGGSSETSAIQYASARYQRPKTGQTSLSDQATNHSTISMVNSRSSDANSRTATKTARNFKESEGSLPYSQQLVN
jgi:hypothetical protein